MKYIALVLVIAVLVWAQNDTGISTANGVMSAYGTGKQSIQAKYAAIVLSIEADAATAREASAIVSNSSRAVVDELRGLNVTKLQTYNYNLYPKFEYTNGTSVQVGYTVRLSFSFQIVTEDAGGAIDAAIEAGANRVESVSFVADDAEMNAASRDALVAATEDALDQARTVLGVLQLCISGYPAIGVSNIVPTPPIVYYNAQADASSGTPILAGDMIITATVTISLNYTTC